MILLVTLNLAALNPTSDVYHFYEDDHPFLAFWKLFDISVGFNQAALVVSQTKKT